MTQAEVEAFADRAAKAIASIERMGSAFDYAIGQLEEMGTPEAKVILAGMQARLKGEHVGH